jgi:hypothetical protein
LDNERLQKRFHQLLNSKKEALFLNNFSTIFQTSKIYHMRIGAIWVMEENKDQKGNENSDRIEPFVCPFAKSEQKLRELWKQALA